MSNRVRARGRVKWWNETKGYGFIVNQDTGDDVFVHYKNVPGAKGKKNLQEGDEVTYIEGEREDGRYAVMVEEVKRS